MVLALSLGGLDDVPLSWRKMIGGESLGPWTRMVVEQGLLRPTPVKRHRPRWLTPGAKRA